MASSTLAGQPQQCCTIGVRHEGTPTGELQMIAGTETYVATPSGNNTKPATALLLFSDVIGHKFVNTQLIADQLAANGYYTIVPDLFEGDPIPLNRGPDFSMPKWREGEAGGGKGPGHGPERVQPIADAAVKYLREEKGIKKIGALGYCFGAKYVIRGLAQGGGVDVGYMAHPSWVESEELEKITGPLSIAAAETDAIFPAPMRHSSEEILVKTKQPYQINLYSGTVHGFAVRGDPEDPQVRFGKEQAFYQAVLWFDQWLK